MLVDIESECGASQQQSTIEFKRSWLSEKLPKGYRLVTIREVELHRTEISFSGALHAWDISQLLDGWIDGPGYANLPVREFRPNLGTRLLIRKLPNEGDKYQWIKLDEEGRRIAFLYACEVGLKAVEPFLQMFRGKIEAGPEVGISFSPLHAAILSRDFHLCCKLVEKGADVNRALGSTEARHFDAIQDIKFSSLTGATPLHLAIAFNRQKIILDCLLISKDINLQACDEANRTALDYAVLSGDKDVFEALLSSRKIDLCCCDKAGVTILHAAAAAENSAFLHILLKSKDVDFTICDTAGRSALHIAAASGKVGNVKALIPRMRSIIQKADSSGKIPLVYAIESWQPQVISDLLINDRRKLQAMGEVKVEQSITLKTPLHYAVHMMKKEPYMDHHSMLKPIVEYATFKTREMLDLFWDENAWLYRHAKHVRVQQLLAEYLAKAGSQSNRYELSDDYETSIQRAAKAGLVDLIRLLLANQPNLLQELESESWTRRLTAAENAQVLDVRRICDIELMYRGDSSIIKEFCQQATDQPALDDFLGRRELVEGLATLLLNPFTGMPLTIGIYGAWGHGKSSIMRQVPFFSNSRQSTSEAH